MGRLGLEIGAFLLLMIGLAAAWKWTPLGDWLAPERLGALLEPYRNSWIGLPLVVGVFVVAELVLFPVLLLVFVCGLAFGPWLGAAYAMAGALASAVIPFYIGRRLGRGRLQRFGGAAIERLDRALQRKGVIAVFLVRKIPAPYTVVNIACGASGVHLRDFLLGTFLGMVTGVILITVVGAQFFELLSDPAPGRIALAVGVLGGAVGLAFLSQWLVNRRLQAAP